MSHGTNRNLNSIANHRCSCRPRAELRQLITPIRKYCHNCNNWVWDKTIHFEDGHTAYPGHCGIMSGRCINAVADGDKLPPYDFHPVEGVPDE